LAIAYIKTSEDNAYPQHLAAEVDHLKKDNEFKDGQIEILKKKLDEVSDNPDSTERVEQLETMVTTLTSSNKTLQENNGLLKDKIETLGSGDSLLQNLVVDMKSDIEAAANELTDTRKLLADAEKSIVELTKPEKTKPKSKKTETAKSD
jgi:chromosome segregation ATPase